MSIGGYWIDHRNAGLGQDPSGQPASAATRTVHHAAPPTARALGVDYTGKSGLRCLALLALPPAKPIPHVRMRTGMLNR